MSCQYDTQKLRVESNPRDLAMLLLKLLRAPYFHLVSGKAEGKEPSNIKQIVSKQLPNV